MTQSAYELPFLLTPSPAMILQAREGLRLTQVEASDFVWNGERAWQSWEYGERRMPAANWYTFTHRAVNRHHPGWLAALKEPGRTPYAADLKQARATAGMSQTKAAEVIFCSLRAWQAWESGHSQMTPAFWWAWHHRVSLLVAAPAAEAASPPAAAGPP